ncbi:MAG TPA: hypothetical protein VKM93_05250 [Terriglobia bacterium]|nr:hypothetical protein [Terriglobia bacterium]
MLGYVQTDTRVKWLDRLKNGFAERKEGLRVQKGGALAEANRLQDLGPLLMSCHGRQPAILGQIKIFHLLLDFLPPAPPGT